MCGGFARLCRSAGIRLIPLASSSELFSRRGWTIGLSSEWWRWQIFVSRDLFEIRIFPGEGKRKHGEEQIYQPRLAGIHPCEASWITRGLSGFHLSQWMLQATNVSIFDLSGDRIKRMVASEDRNKLGNRLFTPNQYKKSMDRPWLLPIRAQDCGIIDVTL